MLEVSLLSTGTVADLPLVSNKPYTVTLTYSTTTVTVTTTVRPTVTATEAATADPVSGDTSNSDTSGNVFRYTTCGKLVTHTATTPSSNSDPTVDQTRTCHCT